MDDLILGRPVRIEPDVSVERGGAVVSFGAGSIRAQTSEALARVRSALAEAPATESPGAASAGGAAATAGTAVLDGRPVFPGDLIEHTEVDWEDER